ncbi:MAG: NADH-quinone oxidoreductase subunit C [Candidatus Omnitrophica bacterium]|nr:NADH-quinone oxidoreductase subunit C [Candidatus Omnitrophota bacterium]
MNSLKTQVKERLSPWVINWYEHSARRVYIDVKIEALKEIAKILFKDLGLRFATASGCDTPRGIEILYHFSFDSTGEIFSLRVLIEDRNNPQIDSLATLFSGAEWIEREIWELLGVNFKGHPNLKHLLLVEDWPEGKYPLRKNRKIIQ